ERIRCLSGSQLAPGVASAPRWWCTSPGILVSGRKGDEPDPSQRLEGTMKVYRSLSGRTDDQLRTALAEGMRAGQVAAQLRPLVAELKARGALDAPDALGLSPLMGAAALGRLDVVRELVAQ